MPTNSRIKNEKTGSGAGESRGLPTFKVARWQRKFQTVPRGTLSRPN